MHRVPAGTTPLDHTSILKTIETRWGLPALTARDAAAPSVGDVLTLTEPRTDDPLAGVVAPQTAQINPDEDRPSHLQMILAQLVAHLPVPDGSGHKHHVMPQLSTNREYREYMQSRTEAWKASRKR
jgi:phospholipase C